MNTRAEREKHASDETDVYLNYHRLRRRFSHIFECPNSLFIEQYLDCLLQELVPGKRVLEIGCGNGSFAQRLISFGVTFVRAVDISEKRIAEAKKFELPGKCEYMVADVLQPIEGTFDLIVGRSVLHHLDYQEVLLRITRDNLATGGCLLFYEPLRENWLMRLYQLLSRNAHTADERPFDRSDLVWMKQHFSGFILVPVNFFSIPLGMLSSFFFHSANNSLLCLADRFDRFLAEHGPLWLKAHFRCGLLILSIKEAPKA